MTESHKPRRMIDHRPGFIRQREHDENAECVSVGCVPVPEPASSRDAQAQQTPPTPLVRALMTISQLAAAMAFENFEAEREHRHVDHRRIALQADKIQAAVKGALAMVDAGQQQEDLRLEWSKDDGYDVLTLIGHSAGEISAIATTRELALHLMGDQIFAWFADACEDCRDKKDLMHPVKRQPAESDTAEIATLKAQVVSLRSQLAREKLFT